MATLPQSRAGLLCTTVLPNNGVVDGLPGAAVPYQSCLALIGNTQTRESLWRDARAADRVSECRELALPDLLGVMLNPSGLWENLRELLLRDRFDLTRLVKNDGA